jgi:omega-6 fatty acid desaturase (delta-12 desaturase)
MNSFTKSFKSSRGFKYHTLAVLYAVTAYLLGFSLLWSGSILLNLFGVLALAHGMVIAAYMIHECGHNTVFRSNADNATLGSALTWLCGAAYGTYEDIRYKHFRHHVDNDDVVWFDYEAFFKRHPLIYRITITLEYFYIPAHELVMHFILVFCSFIIPERKIQRRRNVSVIVVRGGVFVALLCLFPKVALLYSIAYMMMMTVLRFMDSLQHDYGYHLTLFSREPAPHKGDFTFEQEHTFSVPHSLRFERLGWLTLNFGYHNAHHANMMTPWWQLPVLHRELIGDDPAEVIPLRAQLAIFHRYRVERIVGGAAGEDEGSGDDEPWGRPFLEAAREGRVMGGNAASFLTAF